MKPIKLQSHKVEKIWGTNQFGPNIGENWVFCDLDVGSSNVQGLPLHSWLKKNNWNVSDVFGSQTDGKAHFLIKFILAKEYLSIQVHPKPKNECWYILGSGQNQGIYLGVKEGIHLADIQKAFDGTLQWPDILQFYNVLPGQVYYVPAGTIHAIGPHVYILEIQNPVDCTYRIWDWNRQNREIHREKALETIQALYLGTKVEANQQVSEQFSCNDFSFRIFTNSGYLKQSLFNYKGVKALVCLEGEIKIGNEFLMPQDTLLIPFCYCETLYIEFPNDIPSKYMFIY